MKGKRIGIHAPVRPVFPWDLDVPVRAVTSEQLNALMLARTPTALVDAADECGPLRVMRENLGSEGARERLLLDGEELTGLVGDGTLLPADANALVDELVFDPFVRLGEDGRFERTVRRPVRDCRRLAEERSLPNMEDILGSVSGGAERLFEVEPMQDWALARNLISVGARIVTLTRTGDAWGGGREILELAGFVEASRSELLSGLAGGEGRSWAIPILHNIFGEDSIVEGGAGQAAELASPLLARVTERHDAGCRLALAGAPEVRVVSVASSGVEKKMPEEGWLCLAPEGDDQDAMADMLVRAIDHLLARGRVTRRGYDFGEVPCRHPDAPSALWATVRQHGRHRLVSCKQCGRTVLVTRQGPPREFCSDACRSLSAKRTREPFLG